MLAAMLGIVAANAQGTGTVVVANGTETESDVPINGWYADYYQRSQIIYPASMLTDIVGSEIHGITYYLQTPADEAFDGGVFVVKIGTTSATAFDDAVYIDASSFTTVYTGTLDCTQDELTINFLSPYVYSGESLVIEIAETTPSENYPSATFYGIESEGGSLHGYVSSYYGNSVDDIDDIDVYDFIPKTGFIVPVNCAIPTITSVTPTDVTAVIAWSGDASSYSIKLDNGSWTTVTGNTHTFSDLTSNTQYTVYLRSICGEGDTSMMATTSFRTSCVTQTLPYEEDFTSHTAGSAPYCWTTVLANGTYPKIGNTASSATDGNYLELYGSYSNHLCMIASPILDRNANTLYLSFDAWLSNYTSDTLYVGVIDDVINAATFTSVFSLVGNQNGGTWKNYEINLSTVAAIASSTSKYIAFRFYGSSDYCRIDNIVVSEPPACAKPTDLTLDEATENSLTLSWIEAGSATKWVVKVNDGDWATVTENPYTISGLTANTEYAITVRAFCDPDTSDAVSGTFRTACATEVVTTDDSFEEEFEGITSGIPTCWAQTTTTWKSYATGNTGRGLYFTDYYGHVDTLITPEFNLSALTNGAQLRFWYKIPEEEDWYGDAISATLQVLYRTSTDGEWTVGETLTETVEDWTEHEFVLPASTAAASYQIAFRAVSANDYTDTYVYLDNVTVEAAPTCLRPTSGTITGVTPESAIVNWDAVAGATGYDVAYGETNDVDAATVVSADDATKTLEGLDPETDYYVWVRTVCGSDNANWLALGSFTTDVACAQVTGLSLTEATLNSITIGWTIDDGTGYASTAVIVGYKEADASEWTATEVTGNTFTLDNLGEGETYNFRVINICGTDTANYVALTASSKVCGEVADGSTTISNIPSNIYYNYSYSQAIYTAAEVGDIDTISGISYNFNGSGDPVRTVSVYIADVENASFADGYLDINLFTPVAVDYDWTIANGWSEIVFDTPFIHESGKDIVIAFDDNTGDYESSVTFKAHNGNGYAYSNDYTNSDPENPTGGSATTKVADIRFTANCGGSVQPVTCDVPTGLAANNVTENSAVISWTGNAAEYEVELNGQASTVTTNSYNATGLTAATDYAVRVRALCDGGLTSDWTAVVNFTTLDNGDTPVECDVPTNIVIDQESINTPYAALITWNGTASQYEIEITGGEQPVTSTVSTNSYTFNGVASTTYSVRVRAICDGGVTSDWSAAQSFTTPNGGEPQGIDDVNASYSVNIYPNPAKNTVTISVDGLNGKAQVSVIDMSGRTVMTSTMESDATQLNVSKLAQGTYFVRINGETISTVRKLVVK